MTIAKVTPVLVLSLLICLVAVPTLAQSQKDEAAIRMIVEDESTAWNNGDAVAYARHFAEDGTFTNILGEFYRGHSAFVTEHEHILKTIFLDSTIHQDIVSMRFITPDAAVVEVLTAVAGAKLPRSRGDSFDAQGRLRTRLLQVFVRRNSAWEIMAYHNVEVRDALHLREPKGPTFK
ncbi:MAG: SgcJ/EcaC family oxidoreductase [Candidatus Acidiferrales bacterium]